jgi:hypothetical protein
MGWCVISDGVEDLDEWARDPEQRDVERSRDPKRRRRCRPSAAEEVSTQSGSNVDPEM